MMSDLWKKSLGIVLIGAGIIGLVLPLVPGIQLIVLGASFLGHKHIMTSLRSRLRK